MIASNERRKEPRVKFFWPLWFGHEHERELRRGQAFDLCREGVSFTVDDSECPAVGSHVMTRFSFPLDQADGFQMDSYADWGEVMRVGPVAGNRRRVALRLHRPLGQAPAGTLPQTNERVAEALIEEPVLV